MNTACYNLTPRFQGALKAIINCNILEKITVKVTNACITFYYAIQTSIKDTHRKTLKNDYCEQCVSNVVDEVTYIKATFGFLTSLVPEYSLFSRIKDFTLEFTKGMANTEAIDAFLNNTKQKNISYI